MSLSARLPGALFHICFSLYCLALAPWILTRLQRSVADGHAQPALAAVILLIGVLEIPALYVKIQAVVRRLEAAEAGERPGLIFILWFCHFVMSGIALFAFFEASGLGTNQNDWHMSAGIGVLIVKEFWLAGVLFIARGRAVPPWLERAADIVLFAFSCLMYTVFWQFSMGRAGLDVYALPLFFVNLILMGFFFLLMYGGTQIPYLWFHRASLNTENEYSQWLLSFVATAVITVVPIAWGALAGRHGSLESALANADSARTLVLVRDQLKELDARVGELPRLQTLYAHENQLQSLPATLGQLRSLETLQVSYNRLESLPASIGRLRRLRVLKAYVNRLTTLPPEIVGLHSLEVLHVGWNPIERLPAEVLELGRLRELNVSQCRLTSLPAEISRLRNLRVLKAPGNRLRAVPESLFAMQLKELDLRNNPLPPAMRRRLFQHFGTAMPDHPDNRSKNARRQPTPQFP